MPALPDVVVQLRVAGLPGVKSAFAEFDKMLAQLGQRESKAANSAARTRVRAEQDANKEIVRDANRAAAAKEHADRQAARNSERAAQDAIRAEQRAKDNAARSEERRVVSLSKYRERVVQNSLRMEQTMRERQLANEEALVKRAQSRRQQITQTAGRSVGGAVSTGIGAVGKIAAIGAGVLGGFSIADAIQRSVQEEKIAGATVRGADITGGLSTKDVLAKAKTTAISHGLETTDVLSGLDVFVRNTGDLKAAAGMLDELATHATAAGVSMEDLGAMSAEFFKTLRLQGKEDQLFDVIRSMIAQGKKGAIDIKDLGQFGGRLASSAGQFEGDVASNMKAFGAFAQAARETGGKSDAAEATMSAQRLADDMIENADKFRAIGKPGLTEKERKALKFGTSGVEIYADASQNKLASPIDSVVKTIAATKGDLTQLQDLFGERSMGVVKGAQQIYANAGGGEKGEAALRAKMAEFMSANMSQADIQKSFAEAMEENNRKIVRAQEEYRKAIEEKLLPKLPELIDAFSKLIPSITSILDWLSKDAWHAIGGIAGAAIAAEIAKAAIAGVITKGFTLLMSGALAAAAAGKAAVVGAPAGVAAVNAAQAGGATTALGSVAAPVGVGAAAAMGGAAIGYGLKSFYGSGVGDKKASLEQLIAASSKSVDEQGGVDKARANRAALLEEIQKGEGAKRFNAAAAYAPVALGSSSKQATDSAIIEKLPQLTAALEAATKNLEKFGAATDGALASLSGDGTADPNSPSRKPISLGSREPY